MKYLYIGLIMIFVAMNFSFWASAETRQKIEVSRYKHASESAADSACHTVRYCDENSLRAVGNGFGEGLESPLNIAIEKSKALENFEAVLFGNLNISEDPLKVEIRSKIILSVVIDFDGITLKRGSENWGAKESFIIELAGQRYGLNFSKQVLRISDGIWLREGEVAGLTESIIRNKINADISRKINDELLSIAASAEHGENGEMRGLRFLSDVTGENKELNSFSGPGFLAIIDGVKIPGMNIEGRDRINVYSVGGSDINN